jgi:putative transcriptional regulator
MKLETPVLLVAMPQVQDPFFHMSVVLLVHHQEEGSQGFIVNRPTGVAVSDILSGLDISWSGDEAQTANFGGPVQPQIGTVIYRAENGADRGGVSSVHEVYPGVVLTQNIHDLQTLADNPPGALRLFLGYAGWGEGQLMQEILRNDWMTAPVSHDLVFANDPSETWRRALESVGVDPEQLPTWMPGDANEVAN